MSETHITLTAPNGLSWEQPRGLFINNKFVESHGGYKIATINPATEAEIATVFAATEADVDIAVKAARHALKQPSWNDLGPSDRGKLMYKLADLIEQHKEILATIETMDNGKPFQTSLHDDLEEVQSTFRYYAGWADKLLGQVIVNNPEKLAYTIRQPIGVVGQIIPWNFPLSMAAWKLGPALACGNTVVLKPAEQTPLSILYLADLIVQAGFPPGVVNVINGRGFETGVAIVNHPGIDKVAFTGSTATGREIMKIASSTLKNITLETGGKSPLLVFEDADLEQAAKWAHTGIMYNQGQVCSATSRILVQEKVYTKFCTLFKEVTNKLSIVGDPFTDDTFQGPQVTKAQYEKISSYLTSARSEGVSVVTGGHAVKGPGDGKGFYIAPTILADVAPSTRVYREEIFGPVAVVAKFADESEAINMANDSMYGLGAALFTQSAERCHRVAGQLEAGMVWINSSNDIDIRVPFGGVKQSGIGRELGEEALQAYTQLKAIHWNLGSKL